MNNSNESEALRKLATRPAWRGGWLDPDRKNATPYHGDAWSSLQDVRALLARGVLEVSLQSPTGQFLPWSELTDDEKGDTLRGGMGWPWWVRVSAAGRIALAEAAKRPLPSAENTTEPERAIALYQWAVEQTGDPKLTDDAAYQYIRTHAEGEPLAKLQTFKRYLGRARAQLDVRKAPNKRPHFPARSAVRRGEV